MHKRELWIDSIKTIACILVLSGHLLMGVKDAAIISDSDVYSWFIQTIYYFHVPLFFICSGYLYQKNSKVHDVKSWGVNICNKFINLGIPYFTFTLCTIILKNKFSGSVNSLGGDFLETLFIQPTSPYWYLYALLLMYLISWNARNKKGLLILLSAAILLRVLRVIIQTEYSCPVEYIMTYDIWFAAGMCLTEVSYDRVLKGRLGLVSGSIFIILSVFIANVNILSIYLNLGMGVLGCVAVIACVYGFEKKYGQLKVFQFLSRYTMPIFLMHTIFSGGIRSVLLVCRVYSAPVHIVLGFAVGIAGPILAARIMQSTKYLGILLYPGRYIKINNNVSI